MGGALPGYVVKYLVFSLTFSILLGSVCTVIATYTPLFSDYPLAVPSFSSPPDVEYDNVTYAHGWNSTYN